MLRTFLALELPDALAAKLRELLQLYSRATPQGVNWVKPDNLHLTLLFIGDVHEHLIKGIDARLQDLLAQMNAFTFRAEGLELFPAREPRLLWLKLSTPDQRILQLNRILQKELENLGAMPDPKALKLHVTLARLKQNLPESLARELLQYPFDHDPQAYDTLNLYRSVLNPSGPKYSVINSYKLN